MTGFTVLDWGLKFYLLLDVYSSLSIGQMHLCVK
jgi:hypothetical protein